MSYTFRELVTLWGQVLLVLIVQSCIEIHQESLSLLYHALPVDHPFMPVIYAVVEQNNLFSRRVREVWERLLVLLGFAPVNDKQTQTD